MWVFRNFSVASLGFYNMTLLVDPEKSKNMLKDIVVAKKIEHIDPCQFDDGLLFYPSGVIILITNGLTPKNPNT